MAVTIKDIANKAKVSTATVSKVLNNKDDDIGRDTIIRVKQIAADEGYVRNALAKAIRTNRSHIIGLLIPDIRNPFFTEIARGAEDLAYDMGYSLFLCNTDDDLNKEKNYIDSLQQLRIDGIIIAGSLQRNPNVEISLGFDIPLIAIDREIYYKNVSSFIKTNNYESSKNLVEKLYLGGYRSFYYLGGPESNSVSQERYRGTVDGLNSKEIKCFNKNFGKFTIKDGYRITSKIKNIMKYEVIICGNDLIAIGVLNALKDKNIKVPEEISVVGYDDIDLASNFIPRLTTVRQPAYEMGADAMIIINEIIKGKTTKSIHSLNQTLVFRDTTKI